MSHGESTVERLRGRLAPGESAALPILLSVVVVLGVWQLAAGLVPAYSFPNAVELAAAFGRAFGPEARFSPWEQYPITILRVLLAATLCMVVGTVLGIVMGTSERAEEYLIVYVLATFAFPSVIWAFFAVLWVGLSTWFTTVFPVFMVVMPYVAINVYEGIADLDAELPEMAHSFDASQWMVWKDIYVPHLYPHIFANARLTLTLAWKITLVGEIFGTTEGIGRVINSFFRANQNDMILAWVVPMMVLVFAAERVLTVVERRAFSWRVETDRTMTA
ncbi:ABC transporter permease [Haloarcula onubensis]|uniref:ABC transporter permease subunit n=1 Tax=Haloarcula onubensis TaxID=2950539 RepID=A0ABU2FQS6_9EURY|nr:ABC transporter permease subunit [Halomicroarcula sp. S3CR25-11]MDS0282754.1 ABC transporter permease subunit [Halomicroarcula sp. S3CR25-11]